MADFPTFQFQTEETIQVSRPNAAAPSLGVAGGSRDTFGAVRFADTTDLGAGSTLPAFLEEAMAPRLAAMRQQAFYRGVTDARAGKTQKEIHEEQPWYSRLFGPAPYQLGAETFAVQKAAADLETEVITRMPELREMDSSAFGNELTQIGTNLQTGNLYTDALIQKSMIERMGPLMATHAKARYEWQQGELVKGQNGAWLAASQAYQAGSVDTARRGKDHPGQAPTPEEARERKLLFLQAFQSPEEQNPESYLSNVMTTVDQMADRGDWYSVRALEESGLLANLPPDDKEKLDNRIASARMRYKTRLASGPLMKPIAQLFARAKAGAISAEESVNGMLEINAQYSALTGDDVGFFDQDDVVRLSESAAGATYSMWERMMTRQDAAREKAQTAAEKEMAEARGDAQLAAAASTNSLGTVTHMKGGSMEASDRAFNAVISQSPEMMPDVVVGNYAISMAGKEPFVSPRLKARLQNQVALSAGEEYTDGFEQAHQTWASIRYHELDSGTGVDRTSGVAAAIEYYGEFQEPMQRYDEQVRAGTPKEVAYRRTFGNEASFGAGDLRGVNAEATKAARDQLTDVVAKQNPSWWQLGSESMGASAQNFVLNAASRYFERVKRNDPGLSDTDAANQAIQMAQANGLEISGRYAWQNVRGQKPLYAEAGMQKDVFEDYFEQALTNKFRAQGMSVSRATSVSIIRVGNDAKGPRMVAIADLNGERRTIWLTGDDIKAVRNKQVSDEITRREAAVPPGFYYDPTTQSIKPKR